MTDGRLAVDLTDGQTTGCAIRRSFAGYRGEAPRPSAVLLSHNGLHMEIVVDRSNPIGKDDPAGVADLLLEAAITTIQDCEDSVAAVDAADKVDAYRNWLGLMNGTLADTFDKGGRHDDPHAQPGPAVHEARRRQPVAAGRSLMLIRNVGHHMYTDAVLDRPGSEIPEGFLDAAVTSLIALHDLTARRRSATAERDRSIS